ncbi:hypothetical protein GZ77_13975 [Endozoicomonas montiporae]|uniref:Uncharacterized protein n=2 Tax=Endozoicomonas montiporae TaxID=1027273 RepID=A0A081N4U9_9GAMM|nr:hypothetical protein [Endozoicomonas montiporae]AMO57655.1 hypothetical protein EZMO1_3695 [Endozoicomonas montiporae CL-33]KEQ13472.1 hypothetical protein GZ77_13975 [Endozoicomonas montiporae]
MISPAPISPQLTAPEVRAVSPEKASDEPLPVRYMPSPPWPQDHRNRPLPAYTVQTLDESVSLLQVTPALPIFCDLPPLPEMAGIPDALKVSFTMKLGQLVEQLRLEKYAEGTLLYEKLRRFAGVNQHLNTPEILQFLDSLYVLFSLNLGRKDVIDQLPATDPETFIHWHLDIAANAATGSDTLRPSKELELYCFRRAADAGSQTARQHLVLQLLFGQESQAPDLYLPEEALRYIKAMATKQGEPPQPRIMGHHDAVIHKLVKLAASPTAQDRETLARELAEDSDPAIQALAVALYLEPLFGTVDIDRALEAAIPLNAAPESHPCLRYWQAKAQLKKNEPALAKQAEASLNTLVEQGFPAAISLLTGHFIQAKNSFKVENLLATTTKKHKALTQYCPDLAHTLSIACQFPRKALKTTPSNWLTTANKIKACQNYKDIAISQCCPEARLASLAGQAEKLDKYAQPDATSGLPKQARDLLQQCRFSEDPQIMVFIYLDQLLQTGEVDERLLDIAMAMDPVRTCCRLLALETRSGKWSYQALKTTLFSLINDVTDLPDDWQQKTYQKALYFGLIRHHNDLTPDSEKYFRLASQLAHGYQSITPDTTGIYDDLKEDYAKFLMRQGKPEDAKKMFARYEKAKGQRWMLYDAADKVPDDYYIFQKGLPVHYWDLTTLETCSNNTTVASVKYQTLLELHHTIASDPNPAVHQKWFKTCGYFLGDSGKHLTGEQTLDLSQRMVESQKQVKALSASLLNQSRQLIEAKTEQLALTRGSSERLEALRNQWSQVAFPEATRKDITAADSRQAIQQRRLPEKKWNSYVLEHHLEAPLLAAESAEERLELLQQLLAKGLFNTPVITALALETIETLPPERHEEALECLLQLAKRLTDDVTSLENRLHKSSCEHVQSLHEILYKHPDRNDREALELLLEDMKTRAGAENPKQLAEVLRPCLGRQERGLYDQLNMASEPFSEQLKSMVSSTREPDCFLGYAGHLRRKALSDEEIRALQELPEKVRHSEKAQATLFSDYVLGKECRTHILSAAANTKIFRNYRVDLLSIGLEAGIISADDVRQSAELFAKDSACKDVLYALSATTTNELKHYHDKLKASTRLSKDLGSTSTQGCRDSSKECDDSYFVAFGFKSLKMGDFRLAYDCFRSGKCDYGMAMLAWKHGMGSQAGEIDVQADSQIARQLELAAADANTDAQCRLIDWILEESGQAEPPLLRKRACRYLFSPMVVPSSERLFYQGVVEHLGIADASGEQTDKTAGLTKILEALDSDSPIPALRLVQLKENGTLPQTTTGTDGLLLFAQKLNRYTGNLPQELKLAEPAETWKQLADTLEEHSGTIAKADSDVLLTAAQTLRDAVEPPKTITLMPARVQKTAPSHKKVSTAQEEHQLKLQREKEQRAEKEQKILDDLTSRLQDVMAEPQAVIALLSELRKVQGSRFPEVADHLLPRLTNCLPVSADNNDLTVAFFRNIQAKESIDEIINEMLESFRFRFEIRESCLLANDPRSMTEEKETLLGLLPDDLKVSEANREAMCIFTGAFAPDFPEKLQRILKLPHNVAFLQRILLEHPELTPDSHHSLYCSYSLNRDRFDDQDKFSQSKTNEELLDTLFCDLSSFTASDIERFLLKNPYLRAEAKIKYFMLLSLPVKQKLLATVDAKVICEGFCQTATNPRRVLKREELQEKAREILSGERPKITDILSVYMILKGYKDIQLAEQLHPEMQRLSDHYLQTPPEHWDGSIDRLYAIAIKHLLAGEQADSSPPVQR